MVRRFKWYQTRRRSGDGQCLPSAEIKRADCAQAFLRSAGGYPQDTGQPTRYSATCFSQSAPAKAITSCWSFAACCFLMSSWGFRLFLRLCVIRITCHIGLPFSSADSEKRPAPDSFGYRLSMRHKVVDRLASMPCIRARRPEHHQAIDALR